MASEEIEKQWHFDGAKCVIWRDSNGVMHGAAIRDRVPTISVAMPRGSDIDDLVSALQAAVEATTPRRRLIDTNRIADVLLVMSHREIHGRELQRPFRLATDLWVLPAQQSLEQEIVHACDSRGRDSYFSIDLRGPGLFVIVRELPRGTSSFGWDEDQRIRLVVALSRLIRPTPINLRFAVRITGDFHSGAFSMKPAEIRGHAAQAAVMNPAEAWLREADLEELRELLKAWDAAPFDELIPRWLRALWHLEYAMSTPFFHLRWPLIALGFEGLITTNAFGSGRQFRTRLVQIRDFIGLSPISDHDAKQIWKHRSEVVHGERVPDPSTESGRLYELLEETLRHAIVRAIRDPNFRSIFTSSESINTAFPVPKHTSRMATCPECSANFMI